jgi:hypothetical protein
MTRRLEFGGAVYLWVSRLFTCAIQSAKSASLVVVSKKLAIENLQMT